MKKKGHICTLSELVRKYPTRLDLPSESEIRQLISSLVAKQKKGLSTDYTGRKTGIQKPFIDTIIEIFENNKNIAPRIAWQKFIIEYPYVHPLPKDYPEEKQVKSKISSLKVAYKKQNNNNNNNNN